MQTDQNTDINAQLDFVYEVALHRALGLGYSRQRSEDLARDAVKDYYSGAGASNG